MKHNTLKRVLAGSLALLTVASPMTANVGGILQEFAIVASASQGDPVIIRWGYHLYDYLDEVQVGEDVIDFSKLTTPTSEFKFMTGQGKEATIISNVPLAEFGYTDVTAESKEYGFDGIQPGEFTVEKSDDNKWTYNLVLNSASASLDTLEISGATAPATFQFDANGVAGYSETSRLSDFNATITYVGATQEVTAPLVGSNVSGNGDEDPGDFSLTQNTQATITAAANFMVKVRDSEDLQQYQPVPARYNAKTKTYSATVTVPVTVGTVDMTVVALDGTQLVYTADKNYLTVNGDGVEEDQVAASITASAYRAEVRDENEKLIDKEIKEDDFAYNGKIKYGQNENDGVIVKIDSDSKLTTSRDNNDGSTPLVKLSIFKDDSIWAGVENLYFKKDEQGKWTLVDINGDPVTYVETDHVYSKYSLNDNDELTGETILTEDELVSLFNDGTVENPFLFTESGKYVVKATFYTKKYDDQSSTLGSEEQKLEYWFNIEPLKATAQDLTFQLFYDPDFTDPVIGLTPRPVVFNEDGSVVIPVPEKYQNDVYYVQIAPNQSSKTNPEFAKFTAVLNGNAIPTTLADGKGKYYVDGSLTVSRLDETVRVKFENYDQNWGATTDSKNYIIPDITELTYRLSTSDQIPEINLVDDPEDVVYYYEGSSYSSKNYGGILRVAQSDTEAEKFEKIFWSNYKGNAVVENNMDKVQFAYMAGMGKSWEDDYLSLTTNGIPTTVNQDGYTLFVMYDDAPIWSGDLMVVSTKAILRMKESALNQTYGDRLDTENYELVDEDGNVLSDLSLDGLVIKSIYYAADKDAGLKSGRKNGVTPYYNPDGVTYATTIEVTDEHCPGVRELSYNGYYNFMLGQHYDYTNATLNAGTYVVDYDVYYDYNSSFVVKTPEQILNVRKRQITDDMFFVEDQAYNGKDQDRKDIKFRWAAKDEDGKILNELKQDKCDYSGVGAPVQYKHEDDDETYYTIEGEFIRVTVTDGQEHAKDVNRYELALRANELKEYYQGDETCFTGNFTGTAAVDWCVTAREKSGYTPNDPHQNINPGFKWNTKNTSVYDNGRIHVDFSIADENNMNLPKGVTLVDYGVVGCKSDQLAAPTRKTADGREKKLTIEQYEEQKKGGEYNAELFGDELMSEVMGALKYRNLPAGQSSYGNGFFEGHVSAKNREQKIYGANISVLDAQTGEWVLPYALYSDGTVVYGDYPIYLDLTMEATRVLQLKLNPEYYLDKDQGKAYAGYKEDTADYKAYAYYSEIDTTKVKAQVQDFGVVVAKAGQFDRSGMSFDGKTSVEDGLKLSKKDKFNLVIGHNKKDGTILKQEEYGANISVVNPESGVWLNAYLDLGNGLVVYTPCEYYEPVSDYYSGAGIGEGDFDSTAVFQHGALTREDDPDLYHLDLEDLNETAYNADDDDDTNHNRRVTNVNEEENVGNGKIAKPGKVRTTFVNNQYTFQFENTVQGSNPNNYTFVENGVVLCNDDSLVERATFYEPGIDGIEEAITVYRLRKDAANKLVLGNGYIDGNHNRNQNQAVYTGRIENKNNKVQVVRAWQKFVTNEGKEVIVYGDISMNYMGMDLDINEDGIATIQNGQVVRIPVDDGIQAELDFLYDYLRRGYPFHWLWF